MSAAEQQELRELAAKRDALQRQADQREQQACNAGTMAPQAYSWNATHPAGDKSLYLSQLQATRDAPQPQAEASKQPVIDDATVEAAQRAASAILKTGFAPTSGPDAVEADASD